MGGKIVTRGRSVFGAVLIVVLTVGLVSSIGWAQDATPDVDTLDEICATLEASPEGTPESDVATPETGTPETGTPETGTPETGTPETGTSATTTASPESAVTGSPAAELEEELCGTPES